MKYLRIYADQNGDSHFEDVEVAMSPTNLAPPAPRVDVSPLMSSTTVGFLGLPAGYDSPPHPAPQRLLCLGLAGEGEVAVSNGEVRRFAPGSIVLVGSSTW
jgi:hypothetical protein